MPRTKRQSSERIPAHIAKLASAVVRVADGRGFLIEIDDEPHPVVVTASHCLPQLPEPLGPAIYPDVISAIGKKPTIAAECYFVDPIADVALLGCIAPDVEATSAAAYERFVEGRARFSIGEASDVDLSLDDLSAQSEPAWVLSLSGRWSACRCMAFGGPLCLEDVRVGIRPGMSGSPILNDHGEAVGVICIGHGPDGSSPDSNGNPRLTHHLPGRIVSAVPSIARHRKRQRARVRRSWGLWKGQA